jgi:membrane associated rhomboid family serine protease
MLPLRDETRSPGAFPVVTAAIIAINVVVFLMELVVGDAFVTRWSALPADISAGRRLETLLSSMFMHASWSHIIGNMIFLWAFGPEMEDAMGRVRYAVFYLAGGIAAMLAQVALSPGSTVPSLGASGAIAAVMGAFLVTYPRDRIRTVLFFGWIGKISFVPASLLIGLWLLSQVVELGAIGPATQQGGVAYMAHIGGAIFGGLTAKLFERRGRVQAPAGPYA